MVRFEVNVLERALASVNWQCKVLLYFPHMARGLVLLQCGKASALPSLCAVWQFSFCCVQD